jgi:hypothetical protein
VELPNLPSYVRFSAFFSKLYVFARSDSFELTPNQPAFSGAAVHRRIVTVITGIARLSGKLLLLNPWLGLSFENLICISPYFLGNLFTLLF